MGRLECEVCLASVHTHLPYRTDSAECLSLHRTQSSHIFQTQTEHISVEHHYQIRQVQAYN